MFLKLLNLLLNLDNDSMFENCFFIRQDCPSYSQKKPAVGLKFTTEWSKFVT